MSLARSGNSRYSLLLIRHGATDWNQAGRFQGHGDPSLNDQGRLQALELCRSLAGLDLAALYTSDLRRCRETAAPLAAAKGLSVHADACFREVDFGRWDGQTAVKMAKEDSGAWAAWQSDPIRNAPPGGETGSQVWRRFLLGLKQRITVPSGQTAAVVTHGGPIRLVLEKLISGHLHSLSQPALPNGGWLLLTPDAVRRLLDQDHAQG